MTRLALILPLTAWLSLAGCAVAPTPPAKPAFDGSAAVAAVRASGNVSATELDVQPLRDPQVEDLRLQATQLEQKHMYRGAAALLDQAIAIRPDDPALLQERAEMSLLLREPERAEQFARRAIDLGSAVGPLCRRHWETLLQTAMLRADDRVIRRGESEAQATQRVGAAAAETRAARARRDACTVAAPDRY